MGILTGDDLAKHAKLLPRKVIRDLGHMLHQPWYASGNWESVAENLGYGYEEIKHVATMASVKQDVTPGELMLHDWVQQTCGRTLFVLYNALNKADRTDCVEYLEKEIYNRVICTELMICVKYEDGRSASHLCVKTRAESCLLDSVHNLLEQPIHTKYDLLDVGVSWTRTLAEEFKGRQLMLLRRQDCCNMEQDPTVDSSCTDTNLSRHNYMSCSNEIPTGGSVSQFVPVAGNQLRSLSGTELQQIPGSQHRTITQTRFQSLSGSQLHTVSSTQSSCVTGTNLQSATGTKPLIITNSNNVYNGSFRGAVGNLCSTLESMATKSISGVKVTMADNSNIKSPDQNDLNSSFAHKTQTFVSHIPNVMDTSGYVCDSDFKTGSQKCKDINLASSYERPTCSGAACTELVDSSSSNEDNLVFDTVDDERNGMRKHMRDVMEHDEEYKYPCEYLQPVVSESVFSAEMEVMKDLHCQGTVQTYPSEGSDYSEYKDFDKYVYKPPETFLGSLNDSTLTENTDNSPVSDIHGDNRHLESERFATGQPRAANETEGLIGNMDTSDGSKASKRENEIEFEELCSGSSEYQYSGWGKQDGDESNTCEEQAVEYADEHSLVRDVPSASSILSGISRCCSLQSNSESNDLTFNQWGVQSSGGFSYSCNMSDSRNLSSNSESFSFDRLPHIDKQKDIVYCSDTHNNDAHSTKRLDENERRLYLDFNKYTQESPLKNDGDSDSLGSLITKTDTTLGHVSHHGKTGVNLRRFINEDSDQTFRKSVYESLHRGLSCPSNIGYDVSLHFSDTPVIAEVFSPVTDEPRLADEFKCDGELLHTCSSSDSIATQPVKRHNLPFSIQNLNRKRSRQSLPNEKSATFIEHEFQLLTKGSNSPSLPPRRNLPDIRRSSFPTEVIRQSRPDQSQVDKDAVPCKIVIAGKSSRPTLDNLLANDKLYEYYKKRLNGHPGWCPRETENTIEKTMRDTLSSDGCYILWYIRGRKKLALSVSYQQSLVTYLIHTKVMNEKFNFYISPGHNFDDLHELLRYYRDNGVRVNVNHTGDYSSHHGNRICLKCPVRVQYERNLVVSV